MGKSALGKTLKELTAHVAAGAIAMGSGNGLLNWWMSSRQNANLPTSTEQVQPVAGSITQDQALREDLKVKYPKATDDELKVLTQYQTLELYRERCKPGARASANRVWCANVSENSDHLNLDSAREKMQKLAPEYDKVVAKLEGRPLPPPVAQTAPAEGEDSGLLERANQGAKQFVWDHEEVGAALWGTGRGAMLGAGLGALVYAARRGKRWWKGEDKAQVPAPAAAATADGASQAASSGEKMLFRTKKSDKETDALNREFEQSMKAEAAAQGKAGPTAALAVATAAGGAAVTYTPGEAQARPTSTPGAAPPSACDIAFPDNMQAAAACKVGAEEAVKNQPKKPGPAPTL